MNYSTYFELTPDELLQINPAAADLFYSTALVAYLNYNGSLEDLNLDLKAVLVAE